MAELSSYVSPPSLPPTLQHDIDNTFGALMVCTSIGSMLFGLTTHQTYRYFKLYPSDDRRIKALVISLLILDALHTVTSIHICYHYLVNDYFNPLALDISVWSVRMTILETVVVMSLTHSFFVRLGGRRLLPSILIPCRCGAGYLCQSVILDALSTDIKFVSLVTAIALGTTIMTFRSVTFTGFQPYMWMVWILLAIAVVLDVLVTGFLVFYLYKSRTGFRRSDSILDVLMVYTINTGLSTSLLTIPAMFCAIFMRENLIWAAIYVIACKMYANSLLAVLNSRRSLIDKGAEGFETGSFGLQVMEPGARPFQYYKSRTPPIIRSPPQAPTPERNSTAVQRLSWTATHALVPPATSYSNSSSTRHAEPDWKPWDGTPSPEHTLVRTATPTTEPQTPVRSKTAFGWFWWTD
ncbi:hypothetical protein C8Q76DRAFT_791529 [Earliella scabrosa]|nr:hypothetical protein C8Q76DRAFT_791529 [Earliella scabrosa]